MLTNGFQLYFVFSLNNDTLTKVGLCRRKFVSVGKLLLLVYQRGNKSYFHDLCEGSFPLMSFYTSCCVDLRLIYDPRRRYITLTLKKKQNKNID